MINKNNCEDYDETLKTTEIQCKSASVNMREFVLPFMTTYEYLILECQE